MTEKQATDRMLIEAAKDAAELAYCPYSKYQVGAALLGRDGRVFTGANVENASFGGTICAERTAFVKAISEGCRDFVAIGIVCVSGPDCWPCGLCRQFMAEFGVDLDVFVESASGVIQVLKLKELLPRHFGPEALQVKSA